LLRPERGGRLGTSRYWCASPVFRARVRTTAEDYEPLITDATLDEPLDSAILRLHLADGITTDTGRFDVTWTNDGYSRHHDTEGEAFYYRYQRVIE
jgi:hypothetical protein